MLNGQIKEQIKLHALEFPKEEVCGFILSNNQVVRARNTSLNKAKTFSIHPEDYIKAEQIAEISGIYHSHLNKPEFSDFDKVNAFNHKKTYIIYCLKNDKFNVLYPNDYSNKYLGKNFDYQTANCFHLVYDFLLNETGIKINIDNISLNKDWYEKAPNLFFEQFYKYNEFVVVDGGTENIRKYDIILFNYLDRHKEPHHLGIYIDDGLFLHHPRQGFSRIEIFDIIYQSKVTDVIRHKSLC